MAQGLLFRDACVVRSLSAATGMRLAEQVQQDDEMIFEEDATVPMGVPDLEPERLELMIESLVSRRLAKRIIRAAEMARDCHIEQEEKMVFSLNEAEDSYHQA